MSNATNRGNYVQSVVSAALRPGGPLELELEAIVADASNIAMDALYMEGDDRGATFPLDQEELMDGIAHLVGEAMYAATVKYLEDDEPEKLHPEPVSA